MLARTLGDTGNNLVGVGLGEARPAGLFRSTWQDESTCPKNLGHRILPPALSRSRAVSYGCRRMSEAHAKSANTVIPGLTYKPDFLDEDQERRLVEWIDQQEWSSELSRRVQHYGWRYDYGAREVDASMRLGELPALLAELAHRLYERRLVPQLPDQVIVNEYEAGQGITPHADARKSFADGIATISLLESWEMNFHAPRSKDGPRRSSNCGPRRKSNKVPRLLERRSVAVMQGEARWKWRHEIVKRKSDPYVDEAGKRRKRQRNRRISLTFRKVRPAT